jgi:amidohydrolase
MRIPRFLPLLLLVVCLASIAVAQKKTAAKAAPDATGALEQKIAAAAAAIKDKVIAQRRDFHMHPELSNREERTGRVIAERLKDIGFTDVRTNVARNGVVAVLKGGKPGPVVAVRADIDALPINETMNVPYKSQNPGVKHACGHDAHAAVELGVAEVLFGLRDQIPGTIKFIFQPAEEGAPTGEEGGAKLMVKEGALQNPAPQAIFGLHTNPNAEAGQIIYVPGAAMASSDRFLIDVTGKQAHGATPHNGIDAIVVSAQIINALQTIPSRRIRAFDPVVLTVGTVKGGDRFNVIAREVHMEGTLRTLNQEVRQRVKDLMKLEIEGIAKAADATATVTFNDGNFVLYNDPKLVDQTLPVMKRVLGEANVIKGEPMMPSEDFPEYTQQIPGFFYNLGTGNKARGITAGWHTPEYDVDEASLEVGVKLMSSILVDYLQRNAASVPGK